MIPAFLVILACQLAGEAVSRAVHLPVPGPVLGMVLMVVGLSASPRLVALVRPVAQGILSNLLILFVPAGVGAAGHLATLGGQTLPVVLAVIVSTILAIAAGSLTFAAVARATGNTDDGEDMLHPPAGDGA
ncbi:MAG: CidA/LrgA family protein [Paracoccaceae bacterium]